jgi:microcystin-dependent protein
MASPFVAEIRLLGCNFAPRGYAFCRGQILPLAQNTALFSLLGTTYGGNGVSNFGLPDLQGRTPIGAGQGPGLSQRSLGEIGGSENVTLLTTEIPGHTHSISASSATGTQAFPTNAVWAASLSSRSPPPLYSNVTANTPMAPNALSAAGGGQPHNNRQPYLGVNYVIALQGVFPPRS